MSSQPSSPSFPASAPPSQSTGSGQPVSAQGGGSPPTSNATLYLYTFLATLVLLLAVSSAIVVRSLILRRRHQRLVEEAIRTGTWMPNRFDTSTSRRRRDIGQKPKLWEVWFHTPGTDDADHDDDNEKEKSSWPDVAVPFYAAYVNPPILSSPQGPMAPGPMETSRSRLRPSPRFVMRPFRRTRPSSMPLPHSNSTTESPPIGLAGPVLPSSTSSPPVGAPGSTPAVRVAVLVAMPSPPSSSSSSSRKHRSYETGPPVVEIGVIEVDVKDGDTKERSPSRDSS